MSVLNKPNKAEEMKNKILNEQKRKAERNPHAALTGSEEEVTKEPVNKDDVFTYSLNKMVLELADPQQTFGMRKNLDELIGCFFEPEVAKLLKKDQKSKGRGWQSHLVNELVKQYYKNNKNI